MVSHMAQRQDTLFKTGTALCLLMMTGVQKPLAGCFEDVHSYWGYVFERLIEDLRYSPIGVNVCRGWRAAGPYGLLRLMS